MLKMTREDILRIAQIVRDETGNAVLEKNFSMLESRMRSHLMKSEIESMQKYWSYFEKNEQTERNTLRGLMTTHYTFFFREYAHFEKLEEWLNSEITQLKARFNESKTPVRVWSAACSRGQEAYSIAMFLENNLFKKHGIPYEIIGTDIDQESVAYAKNGVYPLKEVNTIPQMYLSEYWKKGTGQIKDYAAVQVSIRNKVRFETLNLLETNTWVEKNKFDIIFCRNVFIYFSAENVRSIALNLAKRLDDNGLLISGMSEPLRFDGWDFQSVGPSCYRRATKVSAPKPTHTAPTVSATQSPHSTPVSSHSKYRVLCVDDSPTIQKLMQRIFSQDPLCEKVDLAENGKEAHLKLKSNKYDLITLDIHMPEVNGIEFLEQFYNKKTDPPVIMISSVNRTDMDLATKSIALGAFDYVEKPAMNNLQKSAEEILTKTKMALRTKEHTSETHDHSFDESLGQKIVVPDASLCVRIVYASDLSKNQLQQIIRGQEHETRSPATLIVWREENKRTSIESQLIAWTKRQIVGIRDQKPYLKPNVIYIINHESASSIIQSLKIKSASLHILDLQVMDRSLLPLQSSSQLLVDETLLGNAKDIEKTLGIRIHEIAPAISFPSLSVEYFANLRTNAA